MIKEFVFFFIFRSGSRCSLQEVFYKKGVHRNFTKFTGKNLCQSLFFNKVAGLRPATLLKKWLWHRFFPVNFAKFLRTPYFTKHLWWLLLWFETTRELFSTNIYLFKVSNRNTKKRCENMFKVNNENTERCQLIYFFSSWFN